MAKGQQHPMKVTQSLLPLLKGGSICILHYRCKGSSRIVQKAADGKGAAASYKKAAAGRRGR